MGLLSRLCSPSSLSSLLSYLSHFFEWICSDGSGDDFIEWVCFVVPVMIFFLMGLNGFAPVMIFLNGFAPVALVMMFFEWV